MTFALTKVTAYGTEASEPLQKRFVQTLILEGTAANTNVAYDIGNYTGTFWTAVGSTLPGSVGLKAVKDINVAARTFMSAEGIGLLGYVQADASIPSVLSLLSSASVGGSASEAYTVTGLASAANGDTILAVTPEIASATGRPALVVLAGTVAGGAATGTATVTGLVAATDTVLAVTQDAKGANSLPLLGYNTPANNAINYVYSADPGGSGTLKVLVSRTSTTDTYVPVSWGTQVTNGLTVTYGANPGAGAKVLVTVSRAAVTAVQAGTYQLSMDATNTNLPDILFLSTDAPTSFKIVYQWSLKDGINPIEAYAAA